MTAGPDAHPAGPDPAGTDPGRVLDAMAELRVLVIGDAILDRYRRGTVEELCREAPAPRMVLHDSADHAGGAANVAANLRGLGASTTLVALTGDDEPGRVLRSLLREAGIGDGTITADDGVATGVSTRFLADGHLMLRLDEGRTGTPGPAATARMRRRVRETLPDVDAVVISDYDRRVLGPAMVTLLTEARRDAPPTLVVDAHRPERFAALRPTAVTPSHSEAARLLGTDALSPAQLGDGAPAVGDELRRRTGAQMVALTLGSRGSLVLAPGRPPARIAAHGPRAVAPVGAGDTFTAAFTLALATGAPAPLAAEVASVAAGTVVTAPGTTLCTAAELRRRLRSTRPEGPAWELPGWLVDPGLPRGRVVFTNGCFDLLHDGHISCLLRAKGLGDVLVVGVNSDDSVRRLKGPTRPVVPLAERMRMLAALACVDVVVAFDTDRPTGLIGELRPDVYVKGDDHRREDLAEAVLVERLGGQVHLLPNVAGRSTTNLLARVRELTPDHGRTTPTDRSER